MSRAKPPEEPAFEVRRSPVHGRGLFARRPLRRGELIGVFEGRPTERDGDHVLWVIDDETEAVRGLRVTNDLRFLNHSDEANALLDLLEVRAARSIRAGEEITIDYGEAWDEE